MAQAPQICQFISNGGRIGQQRALECESMKRPSANPTMQARAVLGKSCDRRQRQRGFSLIVLSLGLTVMLGMLGLAFDLGRMFIVKNELQTFVDASAMAACRTMDGTKTGVQTAHILLPPVRSAPPSQTDGTLTSMPSPT